MEVSFVIPIFNRLDLARPCVDSLRASLPADLTHEIIVVDDGSTDGAREWAAGLHGTPPFVVALHDRNRGYAAAINTGARVAGSRYLALLNSDLIFSRGWLEPMLRLIDSLPRVAIVGNLQYREETGLLDHAGIAVGLQGKPMHLDHTNGPHHLWRPVVGRQAVTGACSLVPRRLFLQFGGFDEQFMNGGEDIDFSYRARSRGLRVLVANRSRVVHHVSASPGRKTHDEQNSRRLCLRWREQLTLDGALAWPREYLAEHWMRPREFEFGLLWRAVVRVCGLVRRPCWHARRIVAANLAREHEHWLKTLGHVSGVI